MLCRPGWRAGLGWIDTIGPRIGCVSRILACRPLFGGLDRYCAVLRSPFTSSPHMCQVLAQSLLTGRANAAGPPSRTLFGSNVDSDIQPLWQDGDRAFCRAWRRQIHGSRAVVLVVRPIAEHPATLDRLAHECELREELDEAWATRPLELIREAGRTMLVLEDPCGEPLLNLLGIRMEPKRFLGLAVGIARAVGKLHRHGLVHKDLKPAHILVNCPDGQVRLTGFGLASRLPASACRLSLPSSSPARCPTWRPNRPDE